MVDSVTDRRGAHPNRPSSSPSIVDETGDAGASSSRLLHAGAPTGRRRHDQDHVGGPRIDLRARPWSPGSPPGTLRPVRLVSETALNISESDLSKRIPVESDDEVGRLARTFNEMLDRLEAFATQRRFVDGAGHARTPITVIRGQLEPSETTPKNASRRWNWSTASSTGCPGWSRTPHPGRSEHPSSSSPPSTSTSSRRCGSSPAWSAEVVLEKADVGVLLGDRQRLTQAVASLVRNAVEHGGGRGVIGGSSKATGRIGRRQRAGCARDVRRAVRALLPG